MGLGMYRVQFMAFALASACGFGIAHAQVNVPTYHNDIARTGQNVAETILTPANVNAAEFGKLFSVPVDGYVYAQPLYVSSVNIAGGSHNVVYVVTEHDSVYAIDADSGTVYAQVSLIPSGGTTVKSTEFNCTDLVPEIGITGTPVIDPASGTLYVVASSAVGGQFFQYLHALDITTLAEKLNGPVAIQATVPGSGYDAKNGAVSFNPLAENQRAALLLTNGHVVITWSSHCDEDPWHGWIISYAASTLTQEAAFNTSPSSGHSGVWMSGGGPAVDPAGNLYIPTGNGDWNGTTDFGDSIIKLGPPSGGQFSVLDYFTPYDQATLNEGDGDVGSGGVLVLPALPSGQQLLTQQGKNGTVFLLDAKNLGKNCRQLTPACTSKDPQIVQEIMGATSGIWGSPAYWNGSVYWAGINDSIRAFSFNANESGLIGTTPASATAQTFNYPGAGISVSSSGGSNGILWAAGSTYCPGGGACQGLFAYDATNLGTLLYDSSQASNQRDASGDLVKFAVPIVANGKVFLTTQSTLVAYGLLAGVLPTATSPTLSPSPGSYTTTQTVTLSDTTPGAVIHYTTDGTTPTASSPAYSAPLQISTSTTLQTIAVASGYTNSAVSRGTYTINPQGTISVSVNLGPLDNLAGIVNPGTAPPNGGLDGEGYAYAGSLLGTSLIWNGSTFNIAAAGGEDALSGGTVALPAGNDASVSILASAVNGAQLNQSFVVTYTDGSTAVFTQSVSDWYSPRNFAGESQALKMANRIAPNGSLSSGPVYVYGYSFTLNPAKTVQSITLPSNRNVVVLAIDVSPAGPTQPTAASPTLSPSPGSYTTTQTVTLSDTTPGAVIHYTTDGTTPTAGSASYSAPLQISTSTTVEAIAVASGYTNSAVSSGTYTINPQGTTSVSVNLASLDNVAGIVNPGTAPTNGGLDREGYAYAGSLLGTSLSWNALTFNIGAAGGADVLSGGTVALPAGNDESLSLLAAGVNGAQLNQSFVVTYTDGSTAVFTQSVSDWYSPRNFAGESQALKMANRIAPNGALSPGPVYVYGYSFALNPAKTVQSITLPNNRNLVILAIDLVPGVAPPPAVSVNLSALDNVAGIVNPGTVPTNGGLDGDGYAYAGSLLGTSLNWNGSTFNIGSAGGEDVLSGGTVALPAGNDASLSILAAAVNGAQHNQSFVVSYTDGSTTVFTQSVSDWYSPQNFAGEAQALKMANRIGPSGALSRGPVYVYAYTFALNPAKSVQSITLPGNRDLVVLAIDLVP